MGFNVETGCRTCRIGNSSRGIPGATFVAMLLTLMPSSGMAQEKPAYALFNLQAGEGVTREEVALLSNRYGAWLSESNALNVVPRQRVNETLLANGFDPASYGSMGKAAVAAAGILKAQYLIVGKVTRKGPLYALDTSLLDGSNGKTVRTVVSEHRGTVEEFAERAIPGNASELLGIPVAGAREPGSWVGKPQLAPGASRSVADAFRDIPWPEISRATSKVFSDHLEAGMRLNHFQLVRTKKSNGFVGSIQELKEEEDYSIYSGDHPLMPPNWFVVYQFDPRWGVELLWNEIRAKGLNGAHVGLTDGTFRLDGPIISVFGRYVNDTPWTPYAGLGAAFYDGHFDAEGWWANGYISQEDYETYGPGSVNGKTHRMYVDDTVGYVVYGGTDVQLWKRLYADIMLRLVVVTTDVSFSGFMGGTRIYTHGTYHVPFDHFAVGAGLKWEF